MLASSHSFYTRRWQTFNERICLILIFLNSNMKKFLIIILSSIIFTSCSKDDNQEITLPNDLNFTGKIRGCSDFSVQQELNAENANIALNIGGKSGESREDLNLTSEIKSFSFPNDDLVCNITVREAPVGSNFCNDVPRPNPDLISRWNAISGTIKLSVSDIEVTEFETYYRLQILLENVIFQKENSNEQRTISRLTIDNVGLGFMPG